MTDLECLIAILPCPRRDLPDKLSACCTSHYNDRSARKLIEYAKNQGYPILGGKAGNPVYRLAETDEEILQICAGYDSRIRTMANTRRKMMKNLKTKEQIEIYDEISQCESADTGRPGI